MSPLLLANAALSLGSIASLTTLGTSGVSLVEAEALTLIYDGKGKQKKDSYFEAYAREVVCKLGLPFSLQSLQAYPPLSLDSGHEVFRLESFPRAILQWSH
jgi:hypothetical protein